MLSREDVLFRFLVQRVCFAESAIFLGFHTIRMCLLILRQVVVTPLALRACQGNLRTHDLHLRYL